MPSYALSLVGVNLRLYLPVDGLSSSPSPSPSPPFLLPSLGVSPLCLCLLQRSGVPALLPMDDVDELLPGSCRPHASTLEDSLLAGLSFWREDGIDLWHGNREWWECPGGLSLLALSVGGFLDGSSPWEGTWEGLTDWRACLLVGLG